MPRWPSPVLLPEDLDRIPRRAIVGLVILAVALFAAVAVIVVGSVDGTGPLRHATTRTEEKIMRPDKLEFEVTRIATPGPGHVGKAEVSDRFLFKTLQTAELVSGEWQIEGSIDGTNFDDVETAITTNGFTVIDGTYSFLRVKCVVAPSVGDPTPKMTMLSMDSRSF